MNYYNYFTEIEEHFVRRRGKPLLVSPLDWSLIATWRDAGVPLHVALRAIDLAMDKFFSGARRDSEKPNTLFYCHDAVMAEYSQYLEAHLGETNPAQSGIPAADANQEPNRQGGPDKNAVVAFLDARISEIKVVQTKHSLGGSAAEGLGRICLRLEELARSVASGGDVEFETLERDLSILDELMVKELRSEVPADELAEWEHEAKRDLKVYKKRLPAETYEKIRGNFVRGKLHRRFNVGELSLFHL